MWTKYLAVVVIVLALCGTALASDVPAVMHSTTQVKAATGIVYGVIVTYKGATAGDVVDINGNDTTQGLYGQNVIKSVAYNANWKDEFDFPRGVIFKGGIHCHYTTTASGTAKTVLLYE